MLACRDFPFLCLGRAKKKKKVRRRFLGSSDRPVWPPRVLRSGEGEPVCASFTSQRWPAHVDVVSCHGCMHRRIRHGQPWLPRAGWAGYQILWGRPCRARDTMHDVHVGSRLPASVLTSSLFRDGLGKQRAWEVSDYFSSSAISLLATPKDGVKDGPVFPT